MLLQKPVEPRLLRRAFFERGEFVGRQTLHDGEEFFLLEPRAVADGAREHRLDDAVEPARIVARHPAREAEQIRRQRGKRMHDLRERLEFIQREIPRCPNFADDAEPQRIDQRHAHERPDGHGAGETFGHTIVQELVKAREWMDPNDHRRPVGAPAARAQPRLCAPNLTRTGD